MALNVLHLLRTADTLEQALLALQNHGDRQDVLFDLYRNTAHDYGEGFANDILKPLPVCLQDVRALATATRKAFDAAA